MDDTITLKLDSDTRYRLAPLAEKAGVSVESLASAVLTGWVALQAIGKTELDPFVEGWCKSDRREAEAEEWPSAEEMKIKQRPTSHW